MKYFNPSYWFKLWVLSAPLFNDKTQGINAKSIDNKKIKDWTSKNTSSLESINEYSNLTNSSINYQPYNLNQVSNQNINPIYQTELETSTHKHRHEKSRNRHKRGINGGTELEASGGLAPHEIYASFKPEMWEEIVWLKRNNNKEDFSEKFKDKMYTGIWKNPAIDNINAMKDLGKTISNNFWTIANKFINSSRKERIKIVVLRKPTGWEIWDHDVSIRTDDTHYYSNKYLDNLERDFPIWNSYETFNLGIVNDLNPKTTIEDDIKSRIKEVYPNFIRLEEISIVDKENYSNFCKCFKFKLYVSNHNYYSFGNLRPTFSYITKTKLNELNNIIANHNLTKQWLKHINDYNKNLPTKIDQLKTYTDSQKWSAKNNEKEIIKGYIRDWSYVSTLIEHELKLDELNKNIQGLKTSFDSIKNQVNELENRVTNLENQSNANCANIATVTAGVVSAIPVFGTIGGAVATVTAGACAIAGV